MSSFFARPLSFPFFSFLILPDCGGLFVSYFPPIFSPFHLFFFHLMPPQRHLLCFLFIHSFLSLKFNLLLTLSLSSLFFLFISSGFSFSFFCTLAMVFYSTHLFSFFIASLLILPCSFIFCCTSLCAAFLYVSPPFLSFRELSFIFHFLSIPSLSHPFLSPLPYPFSFFIFCLLLRIVFKIHSYYDFDITLHLQ